MSLIRDPNATILCPNSMPPVSPEHARHTETLNRVYEAIERDEDGEMSAADERVYRAAEADSTDYGDRMRGYVHSVSGPADGHGYVTAQFAYMRCPVCGLVLPGVFSRR